MKIELHDVGVCPEIPTVTDDISLFDSSFSKSEKVTGKLRLVSVYNAQYASKHPILDANSEIAGYLKDGTRKIGYIYDCVFVDKADTFFLTSNPVGHYSEGGWISVVRATGKYFFSRDIKFEKIDSIYADFGYSWNTKVFKLLSNQDELFLVTSTGFGLVDTLQADFIYTINFDSADSRTIQHIAISPNEKLMAIYFSSMDYHDPVSDEDKFKSYIKIFEINTGRELCCHFMDSNEFFRTNVQFSDDGKSLFLDRRIEGQESSLVYQRQFDLVTKII